MNGKEKGGKYYVLVFACLRRSAAENPSEIIVILAFAGGSIDASGSIKI
ncbi:MAG: hypothetical protein ACFFA1_01305 [Promethearchaeota archaeon]